jgi:predicted transcriptional regulator
VRCDNAGGWQEYAKLLLREINMIAEIPTLSDKELALQSLRRMSDEASMQEISEEFAILAAIRRGETAADAGRVLTHDEIKRRSATWTTK